MEGFTLNQETKVYGGYTQENGLYLLITGASHQRVDSNLYISLQAYKSKADYEAGEQPVQLLTPMLDLSKYFGNVSRNSVLAAATEGKDIYQLAGEKYAEYLTEKGIDFTTIMAD